MELSQQVIVVSGGSSGLGLKTVQHLRQLGTIVVVIDKTQNEKDAFLFSADVSDDKSLSDAFQKIKSQYGIPRVCINCAGIAPAKRIVGKSGVMPLMDFKQVIDVNVIGTFNMMRLFTELLCADSSMDQDQSRGVIINTASIAAFEGQIGQSAYSASKGAIVSMTLPLARELAQFGIRVMTIAPGVMDTPMMAKMPEQVKTNLASEVLFPKRLGMPEEFANLVQHIIENQYLNGSVIRLDGGLRLQ